MGVVDLGDTWLINIAFILWDSICGIMCCGNMSYISAASLNLAVW